MLYMVLESFRGGDPLPVYRRLRDSGRGVPEGLTFVASWVTSDLTRCYQIMECEDRQLLDHWMSQWADLVEFSVERVVTSSEAQAVVAGRL